MGVAFRRGRRSRRSRGRRRPGESRQRGAGPAGPPRNGKGKRPSRIDVYAVLRVEQPEGSHPLELLRLARPGQRRALPGRVQPGLPHLPQRRPGLGAGAPPGPGPGQGAGLAGGPRPLAGRPDHIRRRAHPVRGPGRVSGRPAPRHRPAGQAGHQRHAPRGGRGAALRRPGRRVRGGREGDLRQVPRGERRPGQRGHGPAQPGVDLRSLPPPSRVLLFPHHHGACPRRSGPRRHPGDGPGRRGPCAATVRASGEGTCPSRF